MTDNFVIATTHITSLIKLLNKKNYKATVVEINQILESYKSEGEHHLFRVLFSLIEFSNSGDAKLSKDAYKCQLLASEINSKISQPNFSSLICQAIDNPLSGHKGLIASNQLLSNISKCLKFSKLQEVVFGICLTKSSQQDIRNISNQWIKQKLPDLLRTYVDGDSSSKEKSGFQEISIEILHLLLNFLSSDTDNFIIGKDQFNAFQETLRKDLPKENFPVVLSGFLYSNCDPSFDKCSKENVAVKLDNNFLASYLKELGPVVSQNADDLKLAVNDIDVKIFNPVSIAKIICMFLNTCDEIPSLQIFPIKHTGVVLDKIIIKENDKVMWNFDIFFNVIFDKNKEINKRQIIEELDCNEFNVSSKISLEILTICISKCVTPFPINNFYCKWKCPRAQFSFLKACLMFPDVLYLTSFNHKTCDISSYNIKLDETNNEPLTYWKNIDYVNALLQLSESGLYQEVLELFDKALLTLPPILFLCLLECTVQSNLRSKCLDCIYKMFINNPNIPIQFLKPQKEEHMLLLINAMVDNYKENEQSLKDVRCVIRSAELLHELKEYNVIFPLTQNAINTYNIFRANQNNFRLETIYFAFDVIIYLSKKKFENIKMFLLEILTKELNKTQNYKAIVSYLQNRYPRLLHDQQESKVNIPPEITLELQLRFDLLNLLDKIALSNQNPNLAQDYHAVGIMISRMTNQIKMAASTMPSNHSFSAPQLRALAPQTQSALPPQLTSTRNKLDPTKSAFVPQAKVLRNDMMMGSVTDQQGYSQINNEYNKINRTFASKGHMYSEDNIENELEKHMKKLYEDKISLDRICEMYCNPNAPTRDHITTLIRVLVDELAYFDQYPDKQAKMFCDLFIQILTTDGLLTKDESVTIYEKFNKLYSETKHLSKKELIGRILSTSNQTRQIRRPETEYLQPTQNSLAAVTPPSGHGTIENPPETITDQIYFIINNVSKANVEEKSMNLADIVKNEYMNWFAQYIVMKRVTTESNFHELFIQLIDNMSVKISGLKERILGETYRNIKILLMNMKNDLSDFNDRQILKNLGKFLGMITLSKNKPILHDDMNLKDLLHEAYSKGHIELQYVVPFVTKTVETAKDSIVFRPPCPWTMGILKVLKELHEIETVKLNLKFEVEILCRNLKIDFKTLQSVNYLKDRTIQIETHLCGMMSVDSSNSTNRDIHSDLEQNINAPMASSSGMLMPSSRMRPIGVQGHGNMPPVSAMNPNRLQIQQPMADASSAIDKAPQSFRQSYPHVMGAGGGLTQAPQTRSNYPPLRSVAEINQFMNQMNMQTQPQPHQVAGPQQMAPHIVSSMSVPMGGQIEQSASRQSIPSYDELNVLNISSYFVIDEIPALLQTQVPDLRSLLISQIEKVVNDLVNPLYDRCAKITIGTVEHLVRKDFGLDCEAQILKQNALSMCRYLTAGLCLVTAREIVSVQLSTAIKQAILREYRHVNTQDKEIVESFSNKIVTTNVDICIALLQKSVAERAQLELEKKLGSIDNQVLSVSTTGSSGSNRVPSIIDVQVYDTFNRTIPGFPTHQTFVAPNTDFNYTQVPPIQPATLIPTPKGPQYSYNNITRLFNDVERHMKHIDNMCHNDAIIRKIREVLDLATLAFNKNDNSLMTELANKAITSLMELYHSKILMDLGQPKCMEITERIKEAHMLIIRHIYPVDDSSGYTSIYKVITNVWMSMKETVNTTSYNTGPGKYNTEAFSELLKTHIITLLPVDLYLSKQIQENNLSAIAFTLELLKYFVTGDKREFTVLNEFDLSSSIDSLNNLISKQTKLPHELIQSLHFNMTKINHLFELGNLEKKPLCSYLYNGISLSREFDETTSMTDNTELMIKRWFDNYFSANQRNPQYINNIITSMSQMQVIHNDEHFVRFLRLSTVFVVERAYNNLKQDVKYWVAKNITNMEIDAYAMLLCQLINKMPMIKNDLQAKIALLSKSLGIIAGTLLQEHEVRREFFHPMPFQRIFIMLFNELQNTIDEEKMADFQQHVLTAYVHTYHVIRPKCASAFVFSWLELISHRDFVSKMLRPPTNVNPEYTHGLYVQLLCDLFQFLRPYLENLHLIRPIQLIYKGAVNITCLLMHDFPEILINYHSLLCTKLPINSIQLRNIILCTTTKDMLPLPDVLNSNCVDQVSQMIDPTGYCMSAGDRIKPATLRRELDIYLQSRAPVKFLSELVNGLKKENENNSQNLTVSTSNEIAQEYRIPEEFANRRCYIFKSNGVIHYDVELMNNVLLYLCITAIKVLRDRNIPLNINTIAHTAQMDIIQSLVLNLDNEGRFLLLNCMVNQLRYPNSHTYYFIFTILYLFAEQPQESVKEQITRVILERIIINRPHPWGLLFVMNELFKNPMYKFWDHRFLHCSEEIETILESVGQGFGSSVPHPVRDGNQTIATES